MPAKSKGIGEGILNLLFPPHIGDVVKIAFRILVFKINGWRKETITKGHNRDDSLNTTGSSQEVPRHGFGGTDWYVLGMFTQNPFNNCRLHGIVEGVLVPWALM